MESLETDGTSKKVEDLNWAKQRDATNLTAKQNLSRARVRRGGQ